MACAAALPAGGQAIQLPVGRWRPGLGPGRRDVVLGLHKTSFLVWFGVMSVHVLVYAPRLPRLLFSRGRQAGARIGLVAGSLLAGAALAAATYSLAGPWIHRAHEHEHDGAYAPVMTVRWPLT